MNLTPATSKGALERSIYWQEHVINNSKDPAQIARAKAASALLRVQLKNLDEVQS